MKAWIAIAAAAVASAGCAGRPAGIAQSSGVPEAASLAPTDEEARNAYRNFRYRLACPDEKTCDLKLWQQQPWIGEVSQVECVSATGRSTLRCQFLVHESIPFGAHLHLCSGMFRRKRNDWRLLSVIGPCYGLPVGSA